MYRQLHFTNPTSNPLHAERTSAFICRCADSGALSLTKDRAEATNFSRLATADLASQRMETLVKHLGVRRFLQLEQSGVQADIPAVA